MPPKHVGNRPRADTPSRPLALRGEPPLTINDRELEPSFFPLDMSLRSKQTISLDSYVGMISTLQGRDKASRALAYGSLALSHYAGASFGDDGAADLFSKLSEGIQSGRKLYRLAKPIEELRKFLAAWRKGDLPAWHISLLVAYHLGISSFWACDNVKFFSNIGLTRTLTSEFTDAGCSRGWFVAAVCTTVLAIAQLREHRQERMALWNRYCQLRARGRGRRGQEERKAETTGTEDDEVSDDAEIASLKVQLYFANLKQFDLVTKLIKSVCDMLNAMNMPGMDLPKAITGRRFDDGIMGICGTVSALIVVYNNWPRRKD
mmetsp:Transcript_32061/g.102036  ORF Transcript_32061/g.102036 Transcript_32061/m.102036 type:complete len:319 (-) Transcript_32061:390-1346(-)|eukprot:CAMPEP_0118882784 /NCGR_PEP_ID=MMETSP1163-20130328/21968_1 /TAXON_ID=124430 /ORGANISM="Phaeomonas parva, Strain CCMP2877" /LENGTH=318 /DNA_ID=CAMNT_0006819963 /DNA_START=121 /DNA_END=1077 /DNA_ORIENTATION=+